MSTTFKPIYGSETSIAATLASLTTASWRQIASVDNSVTLATDALCYLTYKTGASGVSTTGYIVVAVATNDGTAWSNGATGSDAAFTPDDQSVLINVIQFPANANAKQYTKVPFHIASYANLPMLPQKWQLLIGNFSGATTDATAGNFAVTYQPLNIQGV